MKTMRLILVAMAIVIISCGLAMADVTGDFKVTGSGYSNDTATVSGSVNNGAIQSRKSVNVDITYDYSFVAEKVVTEPGGTTVLTLFVPGKCITGVPNKEGCFDPKTGEPKAVNGEIWTGTYETSTIVTAPTTKTYTFNGNAGMSAITEPTIDRGRLNPKGKITGYNWRADLSIVANADLVDPTLIPEGFAVVSVVLNSITYKAYLTDAAGAVIADTVLTGNLFPIQ